MYDNAGDAISLLSFFVVVAVDDGDGWGTLNDNVSGKFFYYMAFLLLLLLLLSFCSYVLSATLHFNSNAHSHFQLTHFITEFIIFAIFF